MTLAELAYLRKRLRLTGQQSAFLAALIDAPDGYVSRTHMEALMRVTGYAPADCLASAADILKVVKCRVNRRLPPHLRVTLDRPSAKGSRGGSIKAYGYMLSQAGRAYVLKAISEAARSDDARNRAGAHL